MSHLVVVTGASAGLGAALLTTAPLEAYRVDVSRSGHAPAGGAHLALDLADPAAWPAFGTAMADLVRGRDWDRITVVQSAGTLTPIGFAGEVDTDAYTRNVLLNSAAPQVLGHLALAAMAASAARRELVMISSGAATKPRAGWSSYGAAKAAADQWVRAVGAEQAERGGIRVLAVAPGVLATAMQADIRATDPRDFPGVEHFQRLHDEGELWEPADAARRLWRLLDDPGVETGTATDLRGRA